MTMPENAPSSEVEDVYYKYRSIGDDESESRRRLRQLVVDGSLYFAAPNELNDPYDCRPRVTVPDAGTARRTYERITRATHPKVRKRLRRQWATDWTQGVMEDAEYRDRQLYNVLTDTVGVFCMSAVPNSLLQWSYYGDSHQGVCIGFRLGAYQVQYSENRVDFDLSRLDDSDYKTPALMRAITTKAQDWEHEHEFRALQVRPGPADYGPSIIEDIVFGAATPSESREFVLRLVEEAEIEPRRH